MNITNIKYFLGILLLVFVSCRGRKEVTLNQVSAESKLLEYKHSFSEAAKHKMLGEYPQAIELYTKCIELNPQSDAAYYDLGNLAIIASDFNQAELYIKHATDIKPANIWYQLLLAELYRKNGKTNESLTIYESLVDKHPEKPDLLDDLASMYVSAGKPQSAIETYNRIEAQYGVSEKASLAKNRIFYSQGKKNKIEEELTKLIATFPDDQRFKIMLARYYVDNKQLEKAFTVYQDLLKTSPDDGKVHLQLANYYKIQNQPKKSYEHLKTGFSDDQVDVRDKLNHLLAVFSHDSNFLDSSEIETLLSLLEEKHSESVEVNAFFADYLIQEKKFKEAGKRLRKVLNDKKEDIAIWDKLIMIDIEILNFKSLYSDSYSAMEIFPNQPKFYLYNGLAAIENNNFKKAVKILRDGAELVIDDNQLLAQFYYYVGEAFHKNNEDEKSDAAFEKSIKYNPENLVVLNNYSYYLALRGVKLETARQMSVKCSDLKPNNNIYLDTHAWVLYKMNKFEEAKQNILKALENEGDKNATIIEHYGDILFKLGKKTEAKQQWERAGAVGKGSEKLSEKIEKGILID